MTMVAACPMEGQIRWKVLTVVTPLRNGDREQRKRILQQFKHGVWNDVEEVREILRMESDFDPVG